MSLKDIKDKATKAAKDTATKAEELAQKAKDGVDVDAIKKTAEEAKSNVTAENIKGLDNKKKAMIGGGAIAAVLVLSALFGGGSASADRMALDTSFPSDATATEQCEFIGNYHVSIYQAAANGESSDSILAEMEAANTKTAEDVERNSPEFYFYKELFSAKKKVPRLVESVNSSDFEAMGSDKIAAKIAREGTKRVTKCVGAYGNK